MSNQMPITGSQQNSVDSAGTKSPRTYMELHLAAERKKKGSSKKISHDNDGGPRVEPLQLSHMEAPFKPSKLSMEIKHSPKDHQLNLRPKKR
jgi:hypothetical protein